MSKRVYKFLPEDFDFLLQKIADLKRKIINYGQAMGESTEQSSETWHDNATYDVARMNFEITASELQKLIEIRNKAEIVKKPPSQEKVSIGSIVTIFDMANNRKKRVKITGETIK